MGVMIQYGGSNKHIPMNEDEALGKGWFSAVAQLNQDESKELLYQYALPSGNLLPDILSRYQPHGVHGPSQFVDPRQFSWNDSDWRGVPKSDLILYEMHVGSFTFEGTYKAAAERLTELAQLGVNAIELMPLAQAAGKWNWGYDGVQFFSPSASYGSPDELRLFIDRAHSLGMAVIVDVVYNHFGPEGNYFREFGPYVSHRHSTAWGDSPNFDEENCRFVREYFLANAIYWLDEYHFDGLRVDAIHCIQDESPAHFATELGVWFAAYQDQAERALHLIAESNVYDPQMLRKNSAGGHQFDALWCDDFLHSTFAVLSPGINMSQRDYHPCDLHTTLQRGFVYEGGIHDSRKRVPLSDESQRVDLESLVYAIQNHDFIGNHPLGKRLHQITCLDTQRSAATLLILYPAIPMLFMGEEFASENPFSFFVDYTDLYLRTAVEEGRKREYPQHDWTAVRSPCSFEAFAASKVGSRELGDQRIWTWYQKLLLLRKAAKTLGLLRSETLEANWNNHQSFASLCYRSGSDYLNVSVRLHAPGRILDSIQIPVPGNVLLSHNTSCDPNGNSVYELKEHGVIVESNLAILMAEPTQSAV
ncbi:MAG: hypothetical protein KDB03_09915 [Planctomycetales bacterium]|nr:hypothetical protein [Planctomycetales bacterium]